MEKRKHVRTRHSTVAFDATNSLRHENLEPGRYRIKLAGVGEEHRYVGSFIVKPDHTVEFFGHDLVIDQS